MSRANVSVVTLDFSMHWLFIPPVVAIFTIMLTGIFSSGLGVSVDSAIWALVGLMFILLTTLYGIFIKEYFFKGLMPVQLIAQGILLCPLSLRMGAPALSWLGVVMTISGAMLLVTMYHRARAGLTVPRAEQMVYKPEPAVLPLPFAIANSNGYIIFASETLLKLAHKPRSAISGKKIDALMPLGEETVNMGGKEWNVLHVPMGDGTHYFQLEEAEETTVTLHANTGDDNFIDPATSLYRLSYAVMRVKEELYRIYRYKRWMSALLLRVHFPENVSSVFGAKKESEAFNAYCRFVSSSTRETDILCLVAPRDILVVMPETPLEGTQGVINKLSNFKTRLKEETQGLCDVMDIFESTAYFDASSGIMDFDNLMGKMEMP
ncbi:MAG: hypothetical protein FWG71_04885 [Synergistaceae bacterium]|nr:hypothetical protein [Synergistaceae bacterium]